MRSISKTRKIVIVGGGLLGLSLAYFMSKKGFEDIIVIEKSENLGGACSWIDIGGVIVDRYYHVITSEDGRIFRFMDELGLQDAYGFNKISMGIFDSVKINPISTAIEFMLYPGLGLIDKARLAYTIIYCKYYSDWKKLESISAAQWLVAIGGKSNYEKMWRPIMKSKFGDNLDELNAADMWARIKRLSASRKNDFSQQFAYIRGTPKTLIDRIEARLVERGVTIMKKSAVRKIEISNDNIRRLHLEDGSDIEIDSAIFTIPIPDFAGLLPDSHQTQKNQLKRIEYMDNVCLILKLTKPITDFYMLNIQDESIPFTGIIGSSHVYPDNEFKGHHLFYISRYFKGDEKLLRIDKEELLSLYTPYLKKINPEFNISWIAGYELSKGKNIEPFHHIGYSKDLPEMTSAIKNCFLVTSAQVYPEITVLNTSVKRAEAFVDWFTSKEHGKTND